MSEDLVYCNRCRRPEPGHVTYQVVIEAAPDNWYLCVNCWSELIDWIEGGDE